MRKSPGPDARRACRRECLADEAPTKLRVPEREAARRVRDAGSRRVRAPASGRMCVPMMIAESIAPGHIKSEDEHRRDICVAGRWIHARNFVAATDGNISVRLDPSRVLT